MGESQSAGWSTEAASRAAGPIEGEAERLREVEAAGTTLTAHKMGRYRTGRAKRIRAQRASRIVDPMGESHVSGETISE